MKKITATSLVAAALALLALASPARAGTLVVTDGPTFTPPEVFSANTIVVDTTIGQGALVHLTGSATITPDSSNMASIEVSGTYSADEGDMFSGAYSFSADLNTDTPVDYTISGTVTVFGVPVPFTTSGTIQPGLHVYTGDFQTAPFGFGGGMGNFDATMTLDFGATGSPAAAAPGTLDIAIQQVDFKLDPLPATVAGPSLSENISTRANVGTGDDVLIGGFIINGSDSKTVVIQGIGPSLTDSGVMGALADPTIELRDESGATIDSNDNWMDLSSADQTTLTDHALAPTDDNESALVETLPPGTYTVVLSGVNDTTGVGLVAIYDIDGGTTDSTLGNISTRGMVDTGENVMIGGFILGGGGGGLSTVVVRAIGPSLSAFGVTDPLADPTLELRNGDGDTIDSNDNWMDDPNMQQVSDAGLAPSNPNESALYKILPAGNYTVIVSGAGDTTGVAVVESYDLNSMTATAIK